MLHRSAGSVCEPELPRRVLQHHWLWVLRSYPEMVREMLLLLL
jgi:hypothetical protein